MRFGLVLNDSDPFHAAAELVRGYERAGLAAVLVGEAYTFDAVSRLGYLAARTDTMELVAGILPIYTRTPSLTAMTAAGLDYVSGGRFHLGLGASGPQVIEGFHGVRYDAPVERTREIMEICRQVWRREPVRHTGRLYEVPLPAGTGTGLGKPLKLINHPVRPRIPITLAALGPKNVELAAEAADGWQPLFFHPERADDVWGPALRRGSARRDASLPPLQISVQVSFAIGDPTPERLAPIREQLALYIGGMGSESKNFYNDLARRYGYESEAAKIQELYLGGHKTAAAEAVPEELTRAVSLVGTEADIADKVRAFAAAGVTTLFLNPLAPTAEERLAQARRLVEIAG